MRAIRGNLVLRFLGAWPLAAVIVACSHGGAEMTRGVRGGEGVADPAQGGRAGDGPSTGPLLGAGSGGAGGLMLAPGEGVFGSAGAVAGGVSGAVGAGGANPALSGGGRDGALAGTAGGVAIAGAAGSLVSSSGGANAAGDVIACNFVVQYAASSAISTVEIVSFSTDLPNVSEAHIDFGPAGAAPSLRAPVDLTEPNHRTLLLGMKGSKPYAFHIVASNLGKTCTSSEYAFTTGAVPDFVPSVTRRTWTAGAARGFIVTSQGIGAPTAHPSVFIFDTDGDVVWWAPAPSTTSRAHMSWDGKSMWMMALDIDATSGQVSRASMDGLELESEIAGLTRSHHDFTVLPDGGIATMIWKTIDDGPNAFVERKADGTVTTVIPELAALYASNAFHPNAIHYRAADDSYTLSDRNVNAFVKFKRDGTLVWQLGGANAKGRSFTLSGLDAWQVNHGHHLTEDGHFLFFNNGQTDEPSTVIELVLDEVNFTATKAWQYRAEGVTSPTLGDVERLANGNVFVTFSNAGVMQEVDRTGTVVQAFVSSDASFGYADFRESLYGPPPR